MVPGCSGDIGRGLRGEMGILVWKSGGSGGKNGGFGGWRGEIWGEMEGPRDTGVGNEVLMGSWGMLGVGAGSLEILQGKV